MKPENHVMKWVLFIILVTTPILVWVVSTQPQDIRQRADSTVTCWNHVTEDGSRGLYWNNGCKGAPPTSSIQCTQAMVPLSNEEAYQYKAWITNGRLTTSECGTTTTTLHDIVSRLSIPCAELTEADKRIADVDQSGCVNTLDVYYWKQQREAQK